MDYEEIERLVDLAVQQGGDYEERLLTLFAPFIHSTARRYHSKHCHGILEMEDCVVFAKMAFVMLVRQYDRSRCRKFVPYIRRFVLHQMQKLFEGEIPVPRRAYYRALRGNGSPTVLSLLRPEQLPDERGKEVWS